MYTNERNELVAQILDQLIEAETDVVLDKIAEDYSPEDVFDSDDLYKWAIENINVKKYFWLHPEG